MRKLPSTQIKTLGKQVHGETYFPFFRAEASFAGSRVKATLFSPVSVGSSLLCSQFLFAGYSSQIQVLSTKEKNVEYKAKLRMISALTA